MTDRQLGAGVHVEEVHTATEDVLAAMRRLVPQLSSSATALEADDLAALADDVSTRLLMASVGGEIVGTLSLVLYRIPTGRRAVIEDVVVDESARGHGVATALVSEALRLAAEGGARHVDLTSRPDREAANRLYVSLGFTKRETNVYRYAGTPAGT